MHRHCSSSCVIRRLDCCLRGGQDRHSVLASFGHVHLPMLCGQRIVANSGSSRSKIDRSLGGARAGAALAAADGAPAWRSSPITSSSAAASTGRPLPRGSTSRSVTSSLWRSQPATSSSIGRSGFRWRGNVLHPQRQHGHDVLRAASSDLGYRHDDDGCLQRLLYRHHRLREQWAASAQWRR